MFLLIKYDAATVGMIASVVIICSMVTSLFDMSASSVIPNLVDKNSITKAQSVKTSVSTFFSLSGAMLGAIAVRSYDISGAIVIAMVLLSLTCLLIFTIKINHVPKKKPSNNNKNIINFLKNWYPQFKLGIKVVYVTRCERISSLSILISNAALYSFFFVVLPIWVTKDLHSDPTIMAIIEMNFGIGILLCSLFIKYINNRMGKYLSVIFGIVFMGLGFILSSLTSSILIISIFMVFSGIGFSMFNINLSSLRAAATPDEYRTRMIAGVAFVSSALNPLSTQLFGYYIELSSANNAVMVIGYLIVFSSIVMLFNRDLKLLLLKNSSDIFDAYRNIYPSLYKNSN